MPLKGLTPGSFASFPSPKPSLGTNTGDATATAADISNGKTAYGPNGKIIGSGVNAKPYATGTVISAAATSNYTPSGGGTLARYNAVVTGLNFPNGIAAIIVKKITATTTFTLYDGNTLSSDSSIFEFSGDVYVQMISPAAVSTTGFTLPMSVASTSFTYEVWGN